MRNHTTVNQSKHLLEMGVDVKTSDMHWIYIGLDPYMNDNDKAYEIHLGQVPGMYERIVPSWSTDALLEVIPFHVVLDKGNIGSHKYICALNQHDTPIEDWHRTIEHDTAIDAVYDMVVWLLENGKIDKENIQ